MINSNHKCLLLIYKKRVANLFPIREISLKCVQKIMQYHVPTKTQEKNKQVKQKIISNYICNRLPTKIYQMRTHFAASIRHLCNFKSIDINTAGHAIILAI